jgi:hypothetical protein
MKRCMSLQHETISWVAVRRRLFGGAIGQRLPVAAPSIH